MMEALAIGEKRIEGKEERMGYDVHSKGSGFTGFWFSFRSLNTHSLFKNISTSTH